MLELQRVDESKAGPPPKPENFTGRVRIQNLAQAGGATKVEMLAVHFDAGAHTRPHTHPSEQILHFVRGGGFVRLAGEERQPCRRGASSSSRAASCTCTARPRTGRSAISRSARRTARPRGTRRASRRTGSSTWFRTRLEVKPCVPGTRWVPQFRVLSRIRILRIRMLPASLTCTNQRAPETKRHSETSS